MLIRMQLRILWQTVALGALLSSALVLHSDTSAIGIFESRSDLGITPKGGSIEYDAAKDEYRVTGGGANIWASEDAFEFAWKRITGDATISAEVRFVGESKALHRKAVIMIRQELTPYAAYADLAQHGNGLTSLQFRPSEFAPTQEIRSTVDGPTRIRIERRGNNFTIFAGKADGEMVASGPQTVEMAGTVYAGIGMCSHDADTLETAIFSKVRIEQ
jgi:hypothetical protein